MRIVIVGGVAAGASTAARLRRLNEDAEIIILDKGPHVSFSNCGLPYRLSGVIANTDDLVLMTPQTLKAQYNLDVRVNSEVVSVSTDDNHVVVSAPNEVYTLKYDKLVLTPGVKAIVPNIPGLELMPHFTLKTVPDVAEIIEHLEVTNPLHLTVVGGGFIGVEAAENLRDAGYAVTLIEGSNQLLVPLDREMSKYADSELRRNGVDIIKNQMVTELTSDEVILNSGDVLKTDGVIFAVGVKPDTSFLNTSSIEIDERGFIAVNDNYQTSDKDVYAGGDAILIHNSLSNEMMSLALAGPANKQGRLIADYISGKKILNKGYIGTSIIKVFNLTLANTGLNEKQLINQQIDFNYVYAAPFDRVTLMPGASPIFFKLLFERETGKILGGQAVSRGVADKRIDVLATAIKAEMNVYDLADLELTYAPPYGTGKDAVNKVGYIASNLLEEQFRQVKFTEVYDLVRTKAQLIDIRSPKVFNREHIAGAINIPMEEIRERLSEINSDIPVYVYCHSGQRSYNITMMLQSKGFDAYNVAGSHVFTSHYERAMQNDYPDRENILVKGTN
ncbi:FAD-dependent oxidoreductase [Mollicutes bacterium LVI A0039]|nr:FAD-dependent oxidoreductase [Mollicutes bacterium LVI A0039]